MGPTVTSLVIEPVAVLCLENRLYMLKWPNKFLSLDLTFCLHFLWFKCEFENQTHGVWSSLETYIITLSYRKKENNEKCKKDWNIIKGKKQESGI